MVSLSTKQKILFLGTPQLAAVVLDLLYSTSVKPNSGFQVCGVVTREFLKAKRGRSNSPVFNKAKEIGIQHIYSPTSPNNDEFLSQVVGLQPDLCVTAAYGNLLPQKFLDIPRLGTVNVHPSLLPKYRGAAPVQRSIQAGDKETGVSIVKTVLKMDVGPILAQQKVPIKPEQDAISLSNDLFEKGAHMLIDILPAIWNNNIDQISTPQDESQATYTSKVKFEEGNLDFNQSATILHNKVRAFVEWPGCRATFVKIGDGISRTQILEIKIVKCLVSSETANNEIGQCWFTCHGLNVQCGNQSVLQILVLQPALKRVMTAIEFMHGLHGQELRWENQT